MRAPDYLAVISDRIAELDRTIVDEGSYILAMRDEIDVAEADIYAIADDVRAMVPQGSGGTVEEIIDVLNLFGQVGDDVRAKVTRLRAVIKACGDGAKQAHMRIRDMQAEIEALKMRRAEAEAFLGIEGDVNSG